MGLIEREGYFVCLLHLYSTYVALAALAEGGLMPGATV
jgi:hypothetical protein